MVWYGYGYGMVWYGMVSSMVLVVLWDMAFFLCGGVLACFLFHRGPFHHSYPMSMFPYEENRLRCHPLAAAIVDKQAIQNLTIKSTVQLKVKCSRCNEVFTGRVFNLIHQTNQCSAHKDELSKKKSGYNGHIPSRISRPIRAGLLLGVERDRLVDLIVSLQP